MLSSNHAIAISSANDLEEMQPHSLERNELLTVKEVAELLRAPISWVYERTRKRSLDRLPGIRLGNYWRFRWADVQAWIERQRVGAHTNADVSATMIVDADTGGRVNRKERMTRPRYQEGCLWTRGKRRKMWVVRWRENVLQPDGLVRRI